MSLLALRPGPFGGRVGPGLFRLRLFSAFLFAIFLASTGSLLFLAAPLAALAAALPDLRRRAEMAVLGALAALPFLPPSIYWGGDEALFGMRLAVFILMGLASGLISLFAASLVRGRFLPAAACGLLLWAFWAPSPSPAFSEAAFRPYPAEGAAALLLALLIAALFRKPAAAAPRRLFWLRALWPWPAWILAALAFRGQPFDFSLLWWPLALSAFWEEPSRLFQAPGRPFKGLISSGASAGRPPAEGPQEGPHEGPQERLQERPQERPQERRLKRPRLLILLAFLGSILLSLGSFAPGLSPLLFPSGLLALALLEAISSLSAAKEGHRLFSEAPSVIVKNRMLVAFILCARSDSVSVLASYQAPRSCRLSASLDDGPFECREACLGLGDCLRACPAGAVMESVGDLPPRIDAAKCLGCGQCVRACPRDLVILAPRSASALVACHGTAFMRAMDSLCPTGCLGCGRCRKACPAGAVSRRGDQAPPKIDYLSCASARSGCGQACRASCPRSLPGPAVR